jgi:hypothetical protein
MYSFALINLPADIYEILKRQLHKLSHEGRKLKNNTNIRILVCLEMCAFHRYLVINGL